jgi:hypothetical protein
VRSQGVHDVAARRRVQRGQGLVEDEQVGLAQQRPGEGQSLALATGQVRVLPEDGVVAPREPGDVVVDRHLPRGLDEPVIRHRAAAGQGVADGGLAQRGVLEDERDPLVQVGLPQRAQLGVAEEHPPLVGIEESCQQRGERALSAAGCADQRHESAVRECEGHVVDRDLTSEADGHALEARGGAARGRTRAAPCETGLVEELADGAESGQAGADGLQAGAGDGDRSGDRGPEEDAGHEGGRGHPAGEHPGTSEEGEQRRGEAGRDDEPGRRRHGGGRAGPGTEEVVEGVHRRDVAGPRAADPSVDLGDRQPVDEVDDGASDALLLGRVLGDVRPGSAHRPRVPGHAEEQGDEARQCEAPVHDREGHESGDRCDDQARGVQQRVRDEVVKSRGVVVDDRA